MLSGSDKVKEYLSIVYYTSFQDCTNSPNLSIHLSIHVCSVLRFFPGTANSLDEVGLGELLAAREITGRDLRVDLNARVWWEQVVYKDIQR